MSYGNSSNAVNQPQPSYNSRRQEDGNGGVVQITLPDIPSPPVPPTARRILFFDDLSQQNIVSVLASISWANRQVMNILSGIGYVSHATLLPFASRERRVYNGLGLVRRMGGWFQPTMMIPRPEVGMISSSRGDGVLYVTLWDAPSGIATSLIGCGQFQVEVLFICGPGSAIPPDEPGAQPIWLRYNTGPAPQGPRA